ncbi:MAG: hypothetical protein RIT27_967 [Pseudomonadota bacterium]|jgi:hypothetical protein
MKRSQLALAIAGLLASSSSFATIISGKGTTDPVPVYFVKGLPASQSSMVVIPEAYTTSVSDLAGAKTANALLAVEFNVGFGIPKGTSQFIRVDLGGGAKFSQNLTCEATGSVALECNTREGGAGKTYATFTLSSTNTAITPSDTVSFYFKTVDGTTGVIKAPDSSTPINLTYTLHNSNASADDGPNGSGMLGSSKRTIPYIAFRSPVNVYFAGYNGLDTIPANSLNSSTPNLAATSDLVADVAVDFKQFLINNNNNPTTKLGSLKLEVAGDANSSTFTNLADGSTTNFIATPISSTASNLFSTGTTLELSGDFSFLQDVLADKGTDGYNSADSKVTLANAGSCSSTVTAGTKTVNGSKIVFDLGASAASIVGKNLDVCVTANNVSPIPAVDPIGITFNPKAAGEIKLDAVSQPKFARIVLNGSVLDTPYFSNNGNYINRIVLTNTSSRELDYKILNVVTDKVDAAGNPVPAPAPLMTGGKIPANANLFLLVDKLLPPTGPARVAIRFSITGSNKAVQGVAQTVKKVNVINGGAGDLQTVPLVRQCGGAGCK